MDARDSRSHLHSVLLTVTEEDNEVTSISPDKQEDKESWFYHLSAASAPGEQGPELTNTEKVLSEIMQEGGERGACCVCGVVWGGGGGGRLV